MYKYKVSGHDGVEPFNETGLVLGHTFEEASRNLSDYYSDDSLIKIELVYATDDLIIPLDEAIADKIIDSII